MSESDRKAAEEQRKRNEAYERYFHKKERERDIEEAKQHAKELEEHKRRKGWI